MSSAASLGRLQQVFLLLTLGFIPLLGDIVNMLLNYNLVVKPAKKLDLPNDLVSRMMLNNAISAGIG